MDTKTPPRRLIAASILPGSLLVLQNYGIYSIFPKATPLWALPCLIIVYCLILLIVAVKLQKRIDPWLYGPLGVLVYEIWLAWNWISINIHMSTLIFDFVLLTLSLAGLLSIIKFRRALPKVTWLWFLLFILGLGITEIFQVNTEFGIIRPASIAILGWAIHIVPILWLVFTLRLKGLKPPNAILLSAALEPFLIEKFLGNNISFDVWTSSVPEIRAAKIVFEQLPVFFFLILLPAIILGLDEGRYGRWFTYPISFLVICLLVFLRIIMLQDPSFSFNLHPLAKGIQFVLVLTSPLILVDKFGSKAIPASL